MIAIGRPPRIIEVGGGFSTLVARSTLDQLGLDTELVVIDPEPRTDVSEAASRVIRQRVEQAGLTESDFPPSSILFIDSSHILRTGGDLPFLYCHLLPSLPSDVAVHVHDIYLRYAMGGPGMIVLEATGIRDVASGPLLQARTARPLPRAAPGFGRIIWPPVPFGGTAMQP